MAMKKIKTKDSISELVITDFGNRKISQQNFSRIIALPKAPLKNFKGEEAKIVRIFFVKNNEEQFYKLIPIFDSLS